VSIGRKIKNKLAALLLGNDFVILTAEEHQTYISMKQEYERKLAECEQMVQSLQVEQDEYEYLKHLADTLVRLEKRLHNTDNASEILKETFRAACEFYGADWAGFLEVDPESNVWWPFDWLSVKSGDMTKMYLDEFEPLSIVPRWVAAMELNQAIVLHDREEIKDDYPEEYALYERVKLYSVLAVPVKPRPCGFLAVRNPTRYVDAAFTDVLQLLAFVALVNINDIMQRRMRKLVRSPKDIRSANDIYIKLFGDFEFIADKGTITVDDVERSSTVLFLSYLAIRHKEKLPSYLLDELLAEDGTAKRTVYNIVSQARKDLMPLQKPDLLPAAKNSSGYYFNPVYNIMTDLDRFDELYNNIMEGGNTPRNYLNCMQMMELYEDDIRIDSANEAINNIIRHYRSRFLEVVEKMIHILYESKLYNDIRQAADKGLKIEPCNPVMYFWLIVCSHETSMLTTERDYMEEARKHLVEEEYAEMLEKLAEFGVKI